LIDIRFIRRKGGWVVTKIIEKHEMWGEGSWKLEVGRWKLGAGRWELDDRSLKLEVGC
jgi:hypothetical protein